jgi:outer membrane protein assembly factor BamB
MAFAVACLALAAGAARGEDWPAWRGADGSGISKEKAWNPKALEGVKAKWRVDLGEGYSAVAVQGERVYTMGNDKDQDIVYCLAADTGKELWRHAYACPKGSYAGPRATPLVDDGCVYTFSREGNVFCLDAADGKIKWQRSVMENPGAKNIKWGLTSSPRAAGKLLLLNAGKSGLALNKADGAVVWSSGEGPGAYAAAVVFKAGGTECVAVFGEKAIYGAQLADGKVLWSYPWETSYDVNAADPIVDGSEVFIASGYGKGCALLQIEGGEAKKVWQNELLRAHFSSAVLIGGHIYGMDGNAGGGSLRCIEWKTGAEKWSKELGFGSLMAADGKLIVLNESGRLFVAEASTAGYAELAQCEVATPPAKGKWWTMPVLANGTIYCRNSDGTLVALPVGK